MYRILILAALMVSAMAGLWIMSGSAPLAAQTTPTATRSFDSTTVAPGGQVMVTVAVANYGPFGRLVETLPGGFTYVSSNLSDEQVQHTGQEYRFTLQGEIFGHLHCDGFQYGRTPSFQRRPVGFQSCSRDGRWCL